MSGEKLNQKCFGGNHVTNEVEIYLNVLGPSMENWICRKVSGTNIITPEDRGR